MIDFFLSNPSRIQYGYKTYPKWDWIKRNYKDSIENLINYYHYRITFVNNKHILTRIIKTIDPGYTKDIFSYMKDLETNAKYIARDFKLVNNISKGTIFKNIFYSGNSYEIINHVEFDYDFLEVDKNYSEYNPLRVVYTEETDLDFHLLNGLKEKVKPSLSVFELDITLMLLMYRAWSKRRIKFGFSNNPNIFVSTIVIPNAIKTMVDLIIFNRFIYIAKGIDLPDFKLKHKIYTLDYSRGVDDILSRVANDMVNTNTALEQFINTIPTLFYPNMFSALKLSRRLQTRQSLWATWMARVKYINILLDLLGPNGLTRNNLLINTLPYDIKELKNGKTDYYVKLREVKPIEEEYVKIVDEIVNRL